MNKMRRDINILRRTAMAIIAIAFLLLFAIVPTTSVYASGHSYDSWVREKTGGYNTTQTVTQGFPAKSDAATDGLPDSANGGGKPGVVQRKISEVIVDVGCFIAKALKSGKVDGSSTGIIMGHITSGSGTSIFVFDLMANNLYGIGGALLYTVFRTLALCFLFILTLWRVIRAMFLGEMEAYRAMKDDIAGAVIAFLLLYLMPQAVDWMCTARNATSIYLYDRIVGAGLFDPRATMGSISKTEYNKLVKSVVSGGASGMADTFSPIPGAGVISGKIADYALDKTVEYAPDWMTTTEEIPMSSLDAVYYYIWEEHMSIPNGIAFFMVSSVVPLVYMFNYFKVAVIQVVLFGAFPVFALLGLRDKTLVGKWAAVFMTNIFIPVIDLSIMFLPALVMKKIDAGGLASGFLKSCIIIAIMVSVIPARNQLLNMLGNSFGVRPGSIGGALALGAAAIGGIRAAAGGIGEAVGGAAGIAEGKIAKDEANTRMDDFVKDLDNNGLKGTAADLDRAENEKNTGKNEDGTLNDIGDSNSADSEKKAGDYLNDDDKGGSAQDIDNDIKDEYDHAPNMGDGDPNMGDGDGAGAYDYAPNMGEGDGAGAEENTGTETEQIVQEMKSTEGEGMTPNEAAQQLVEQASANVDDFALPKGMSEEARFEEEDKVASKTEMNDAIKGAIKKDIETSGAVAAASAGIAKGGEIASGVIPRGDDKAANRAADVISASRKMDGNDVKNAKNGRRYENWNTKRLSNLEQIGIHQDAIKELDKSILQEQSARTLAQTNLNSVDKRISNLENKRAKGNISKGAYEKDMRVLNKERESYDEQVRAHEKQIGDYKESRAGLQSRIETCRGIESEFAAIASERGIPGAQTYKDAQSFADSLKVAERMRERATYKNFKTEGVKGYLTPEDRMRFERSENIRKIVSGIGRAGGAAVGAGFTGVAVAAAAAAGEENMEKVAVTSARVAAETSSLVAGVVDKSKEVYDEVNDLSKGINYTKAR